MLRRCCGTVPGCLLVWCRVGEARALWQHPQVREACSAAELDRPRVAMLLGAAKVFDEFFTRDGADAGGYGGGFVDERHLSGDRVLETGC